MMAEEKNLAPPWRERMPDGTLGPEYGPPSAQAFARRLAAFRDWSYKAPKSERKGAAVIAAFMTLEDGSMRTDLPESEMMVYRGVFLQGHSVRFLARKMGVKRDTIKSYVKRLRIKAEAWAKEQTKAEENPDG